MMRLSASAAFSISPPAFSIMPSNLSILAFSSGYSLSLSSKLALAVRDFSISEKGSAMGSPGDGVTHIYLSDSQGNVHIKPFGEPAKSPPASPARLEFDSHFQLHPVGRRDLTVLVYLLQKNEEGIYPGTNPRLIQFGLKFLF